MKRIHHVLLALIALFASGVRAQESDISAYDLAQLPLEQLLDTEVATASKFARQISEAPSAVSIVTAEDIKTYGYRTLADILNSMPGLYTTYDRIYTYLGGRGFGRPGDYTGRIMLLIDGYQANDNLYNQSYLGNDGLLDTNLIERVEYVPGPGSTTYGNGAFFGIINVFTKKGRDFGGLQASAEFSSYQGKKGRLTYGKHLENGADFLLSASSSGSEGQNLFFPEYNDPATNNGVARGLDGEYNRRFFGKGHYERWTLEAAYSLRNKDDPTASFDADFNARPSWYQDSNGFISLKYDDDISRDLKVSTHAYYGQYMFKEKALFSGVLWDESDIGRWWGMDVKFVSTAFANHKILFGGEYRSDYQQDFNYQDFNYPEPTATHHSTYMASAYVQDEYRWRDDISFNLGARLDYGGARVHHLSPRVALIYTPLETTTLKASYGTAFRRPNANEKWYGDNLTLIPNPRLKTEQVYTSELVLEHRPDRNTRLLGSVYYYRTSDLISNEAFPSIPGAIQAMNVAATKTKGVELEFDRHWDNDVRLRGNYAWQLAHDNHGLWQANSPKNLAKLNLSVPFLQQALRAGLEVQYVGGRKSEQRTDVGGYTITNLTLTSGRLLPNLEVSASVRNLFDHKYSAIAPAADTQTTLEQDGRNFWLQLNYDLK